jgi:hypothetical protein
MSMYTFDQGWEKERAQLGGRVPRPDDRCPGVRRGLREALEWRDGPYRDYKAAKKQPTETQLY